MEILSSEVSRCQTPVMMLLKFSTVRNHPECYESQKCPELLLCHRAVSPAEGIPPASKKFKTQPQANSIFLIAGAEDNIRKDWPRNLSLHPSLNYVKFSNSPQNFLWPEEPSTLCSLTAGAGL